MEETLHTSVAEEKPENLVTIGQEAWANTKEGIGEAISTVKETVGTSVRERFGKFKQGFGSLKEKTGGLLGRLGKFASNLTYTAIGSMTPEGRALIDRKQEELSEAVKQKANAVAEKVSAKAEGIWNGTKERVASAKDALVETTKLGATKAWEAGRGIIDRINDGLLQEQLRKLIADSMNMPSIDDLEAQEEAAVAAVRERYQAKRDELQQKRDQMVARVQQLKSRMA